LGVAENGAVVRHTVGYRNYEGLEAAAALAELYRPLGLYVNFFQPLFKLAAQSCDGAKFTKRYHRPDRGADHESRAWIQRIPVGENRR
jgi:hypothetical protein